jgi:hypothetical protein
VEHTDLFKYRRYLKHYLKFGELQKEGAAMILIRKEITNIQNGAQRCDSFPQATMYICHIVTLHPIHMGAKILGVISNIVVTYVSKDFCRLSNWCYKKLPLWTFITVSSHSYLIT